MDLEHRQRIGRIFLKTINSKWGAKLPLSIIIAATESHEWKKKTHGDEDTESDTFSANVKNAYPYKEANKWKKKLLNVAETPKFSAKQLKIMKYWQCPSWRIMGDPVKRL